MNPQTFHIGFERKIGYSFLGLLAGNAASLSALLVLAILRSFDPIRGLSGLTPLWALGMSTVFGFFSLAGWAVVGLPVMFLLPAKFAVRTHWLVAALIGAILGALSLYLIFTAFNGGNIYWLRVTDPAFRETMAFFCAAALIAGIAMAVYCRLLRSEFRDWASENGAPADADPSESFFAL